MGGGRGLVLRGSIYTWVYIILLIDQEILTVLLEDEEGAGEDLQQLGRHHGGRRQVAGAVALQGAGVAHGEHEGGGLQHQHPQRQILQPYMVWRGQRHRRELSGALGGLWNGPKKERVGTNE